MAVFFAVENCRFIDDLPGLVNVYIAIENGHFNSEFSH